jgi:hypothetical protein
MSLVSFEENVCGVCVCVMCSACERVFGGKKRRGNSVVDLNISVFLPGSGSMLFPAS